jgi:hypothetical protein
MNPPEVAAGEKKLGVFFFPRSTAARRRTSAANPAVVLHPVEAA